MGKINPEWIDLILIIMTKTNSKIKAKINNNRKLEQNELLLGNDVEDDDEDDDELIKTVFFYTYSNKIQFQEYKENENSKEFLEDANVEPLSLK